MAVRNPALVCNPDAERAVTRPAVPLDPMSLHALRARTLHGAARCSPHGRALQLGGSSLRSAPVPVAHACQDDGENEGPIVRSRPLYVPRRRARHLRWCARRRFQRMRDGPVSRAVGRARRRKIRCLSRRSVRPHRSFAVVPVSPDAAYSSVRDGRRPGAVPTALLARTARCERNGTNEYRRAFWQRAPCCSCDVHARWGS